MLPMPSALQHRRKSCPSTADIAALQPLITDIPKLKERGCKTPEAEKHNHISIPGWTVETADDILPEGFKPELTRTRSKSTSMLLTDQQQILIQLGKEPERRLSTKLKSIEDDIKRLFKRRSSLGNTDGKENKKNKKNSITDSPRNSVLSNELPLPITTLQANVNDVLPPFKIYIYCPTFNRKLTALEEFIQLQLDFLVEDYTSEATPVLKVLSLRDGKFKASIHLMGFPIGGNIVIRVSGYTLEFYWCNNIDNNIKRNSELFHVSTGMMYCKCVDLPMYVDMNQLDFTIADMDEMQLSATTKEFLGLPQKELASVVTPPIVTVDNSATKSLSVGLCLNPCTA